MTRLTLYSDAPYIGGAEKYLCYLARFLDPERFEVDAVIAPEAELLGQELRGHGVRVSHFPRPGDQWWSAMPAMVRLFRHLGGEVLHMNLPSCYDAGFSSIAWAAKQAGYRRVVSTEHLPMIERKYKKFPIKLFFSHWIDSVISIAESNRPLLIRRHGIDPEKIVAIPNGVPKPDPLSDQERIRLRAEWSGDAGANPNPDPNPNPTQDPVILGIVARLTPRKGHHLLLEALHRLDGVAPIRLVVLGEGEEEANLRALADRLGVSANVLWLGHREDAPKLLQACDLFVLPSSIETMPLTVLEAMAGGVPVLSTSIYGVPELVSDGETGILIPPHDVDALTRALRKLVGDRELRLRMGRSGEERYGTEFTAQIMTRRTEAVYQGHGQEQIRESA